MRIVGLPSSISFCSPSLCVCKWYVCQALLHSDNLLYLCIDDRFAKQVVMLSSCSTFILMMGLPRNTSYLVMPCLYDNIYSALLYLVTLINLQALFCYVVPLNLYIRNGFAKHFTFCQLLLVNQWICQALFYCYWPALPVVYIRDGFAKH